MGSRAKAQPTVTVARIPTIVARKPIAMLDHASQVSALALALVKELSALTVDVV
jgi:hypothetical protein